MVVFSAPVRQIILDLVGTTPGIKAKEMAKAIHWMRGHGPNQKTITSYIALMNLELANHGYHLKGKQGPRGGYTLVRL